MTSFQSSSEQNLIWLVGNKSNKMKFLEELKYLLKGSTVVRQADFKIKAALNTYLRNDDGK